MTGTNILFENLRFSTAFSVSAITFGTLVVVFCNFCTLVTFCNLVTNKLGFAIHKFYMFN